MPASRQASLSGLDPVPARWRWAVIGFDAPKGAEGRLSRDKDRFAERMRGEIWLKWRQSGVFNRKSCDRR